MPVLKLDGSDPIRLPDVGGALVDAPTPDLPPAGLPLPDFGEDPATEIRAFAPVPQIDEEIAGQVPDDSAGNTVVATGNEGLLPPPVPPVFSRAPAGVRAAPDQAPQKKKRGVLRPVLIGGAVLIAIGGGVFGAQRLAVHLDAKEAGARAAQAADAAKADAADAAVPVEPDPPPLEAGAIAAAEAAAAADRGSVATAAPQQPAAASPDDPKPAEPAAADPKPAEPEAAEPAAAEPEAAEPAAAEPAPAEPAPAEPAPVAVAPPVTEGPHKELLDSATVAFDDGKMPVAYKTASASFATKPTKAALLLMVRSACSMGSSSKANAAYSKLALSSRSAIRKECLTLGVDLGS